MDGYPKRQTERAELCGAGTEIPHGSPDGKAVRGIAAEAGVHIERTIVGNCDTTLFLGGKEKTTLKEISEILGKETIDSFNTSETRGRELSHGLNYQKLGKQLMTEDEIAVMDGGMRNPKFVPYETIVRATSGEPEAIDEVLRHYGKRIRLASLENGQVNKDTEDNIKRRLIAALFQFRFDGQPT